MNQKILIPTDISDITLEQFQKYEQLKEEDAQDKDFKIKVINIFTGLDQSLVGSIAKKERESLVTDILQSLDVQCDFKPIFKLNGVEFGFHPNLDEVTGDEYTDMIRYSEDKENLHRLMAVLFRPIKKIDAFGNYSIENYNGTSKYADTMKRTPMNIVNGCLGFFLTLYNDLEIPFLKYMEGELAKALMQ